MMVQSKSSTSSLSSAGRCILTFALGCSRRGLLVSALNMGGLVWGDYELCFPMIDLYHNDIAHRACTERAA